MKKMIKFGTLLGIIMLTGCLRVGTGNFSTPTTTTYNIGGNFVKGESVYAVFTGTDISKSSDYGTIKINGNVSSDILKNIVGPERTEKTEIKRIDIGARLREDTKEIIKTNKLSNSVKKSLSTSVKSISEGSEQIFNVVVTANNLSTFPETSATASAIVIDQNIKVGEKTLNIWLDKRYSDNTEAIKLGEQFFNGSNSSDIYHWITNVFGEEWGQTEYSNLVGKTDTIDILLTDLNESYTVGSYVMGYFDLRDTYTTGSYSKSNEKNMFYIDVRLLTGNFTSTEAEKKEMKQDIYSTLAHEFVHMINWYQKDILKKTTTESWLNEMLAMIGEDLVDNKITVGDTTGITGSKGRLADFNYAYNNYDINDKDGSYSIGDYAIDATYGLYLTRAYAYDNLNFLKDIMHNNKPGTEAIDYALMQKGVSKNFIGTVKDFGKAVILSSADGGTNGDSAVYMNRAINSQSYMGIPYNFEPINVFDYGDFYYKATLAGFQGGANTYAELRGKSDTNTSESWSFTLPVGVEVQLIVKNADGSFNSDKSSNLNNQL